MRTRLPIALLVAVAFASFAAPAQAQRVFVAATGSDGNPCTFASPCRSFQHAHDVTGTGGEIDVLDPAGYGPVTITKAISIQGHGFSGVSVPSGANGITINAPASASVTLNGLLMEGAGIGGNGIVFNSGGNLTVTSCLAQNFTGNGILLQPTSGPVGFTITNTIVPHNGNSGILYLPPSGGATATGTIDRVVANGNGVFGIAVDTETGGGSTLTAVSNSIANSNGNTGISAVSGAGAITLSIDNASAVGNSTGVAGTNTTTVLLGRSVIIGNSTGVSNGTPNTFFTYKDNRINKNTSTDISSPLNTTLSVQ